MVSMFGLFFRGSFDLRIGIWQIGSAVGPLEVRGSGVVALLRRHFHGTISVRSCYFAGGFFLEISICRRAMRGEGSGA